MPDTAPLRVGKYEITDFLGKGAMGVVYRGLDPLLNRYVAIKVMSQGIATDKDLRDRFMREARAAGSLQHPNISTIYDFGEAQGSLYIAMEYIEGSDLSEIIERRDPIPLTGKIDIIVDTLHALDYAHSRGVVHRDVKPANIRVSVDGHAKLMDFGIARLEKSNLTKSGMMIGTPDYMAPEQVTGGTITGATDVFAVGVVLYEFLTNHRTFEGDTIHAVLYKVVSEQPPRLRDISSQIPGALQPILDRALAKDPAHRYPTAGAMAKDLSSVRTAQGGAATVTVTARATPLRTQRISAPQRLAKRLWGRRAVWAGAAAAVLVLGTAAALVVGGRLRRPAPQPAAEPGRAASPPAGRAAESVAMAAPAPPTPAPVAQAESTARPAPVTQAPERGAPHMGGARTALSEFGRRRGTERAPEVKPSPQELSQAAVPIQTPRAGVPPASEPVSAPQPTPTAPAPQQAPPVAAPAVAAPAPDAAPPDPRPQLEALVAAFARAIESRSVPEMRRYYPGLTDQQERSFERFFGGIRGVAVQLDISRLEISGATATFAMTGRYDISYNAGSKGPPHQPVTFQAVAAQAGGAWRLTALR